MTNTGRWLFALTLLPLVAGGAAAQSAAPSGEPKVTGRSITLLPGTCPQVMPGDELVLEWNPAFDVPGGATGVLTMLLSFRKAGQTGPDPQGHREFLLRATYFGKRAGRPSEITQLPNGFLQFRFHVPHQDIEPGEYRVATARSIPRTLEDHAVNAPMTNSPMNSSFCLNVVPWSAPATATVNEK